MAKSLVDIFKAQSVCSAQLLVLAGILETSTFQDQK